MVKRVKRRENKNKIKFFLGTSCGEGECPEYYWGVLPDL
jgi:hypothetical protein